MADRDINDRDIVDTHSNASLAAWLRAVLIGTFVIPAVAFVAIVFWGYQRVHADAESTVSHASALVLRQAQRVFDTAQRIALRVDGATMGSDADVRSREREIHQRLADIASGLPWVVNINVWDADGRGLARSDQYPVDRSVSIADRAYFVTQRDHPVPIGVSEVLTGRLTGRELFNVTIRRQSREGRFNGVIAISLSPDFFRDYYRSLASEQPNLASFVMVRDDGTLLARWPPLTDGRARVDDDNPIFKRVSAGEASGFEQLPSRGTREARIIHFRTVDGLPLYVTAGVGRAAMFASWLRFVTLLAAIFVPITIGLAWVTWVALRKTRREQALSRHMQTEMRLRAQAEKTALEAQKLEALSQLTGSVAHDFNNLLTIVSNNVHMLKRRHPAMAEEKQVDSIARAVKVGVRLTRQLLSFSRKQALRPETIVLQQWLPSTEGLVRSVLGSRIELVYAIDPDVGAIRVDVAELELALVNTALNAQHAMTGNGTLTIVARNVVSKRSDARSMVEVSVRDDGCGIPSHLLTKVFEPFFTTKGGRKGGSGLGLSQVAGLCEQSGGYAIAESEVGEVGHGTAICMVFPREVESVASPVQRASQARSLGGRLLLVEDNDDVAAATEQLLRNAGVDVVRAPDADQALARIDADSAFDMVVSDISMPGSMDGIELAFALHKRFPRLPVLLVTGFAERIEEAVRANLRVLHKPVAPEELVREVGKALAEREAVVA